MQRKTLMPYFSHLAFNVLTAPLRPVEGTQVSTLNPTHDLHEYVSRTDDA